MDCIRNPIWNYSVLGFILSRRIQVSVELIETLVFLNCNEWSADCFLIAEYNITCKSELKYYFCKIKRLPSPIVTLKLAGGKSCP